MSSSALTHQAAQSETVANLPESMLRSEPLQVTLSEAARLLAYNVRTIYRLVTSGELHCVGQGRLRRIPMQSLRDYQQRHLSS